MYSYVVETLGLSQHSLEIMVLSAIGIGLLGIVFVLFWKQIAVGSLGLVCMVVLANHKPPEVITPVPTAVSVEVTPVTNNVTNSENTEFMEDCLSLTDYTDKQCDDIWNKRNKEETVVDNENKLIGE